MAACTGGALITLLHFVYKIKGLNRYFGFASVVALYACTLIRMILPIEFSSVNIVIGEPLLYPLIVKLMNHPVFEPYMEYQKQNSFLYMHVAIIIAVVVTVILLLRFIKKFFAFKNGILLYSNLATTREKKLFNKVRGELGIKKEIRLVVIDEHISPMTFGLIRPIVVIPCNNFDNTELKFVYKHELNHIKNHDTLLKLLVEIYCCIFWWNPFVYLLRRDISQTLEMKCDSRTTANCSEQERFAYLSAILKCLKPKSDNEQTYNEPKDNPLAISEFAALSKSNKAKERFSYVLNPPEKTLTNVLLSVLVFILCMAIILCSYIFIIQPAGGQPPLESFGANLLIDQNNSYLVKQSDGGYSLFFDGEAICYISDEEYAAGGYQLYSVKDE